MGYRKDAWNGALNTVGIIPRGLHSLLLNPIIDVGRTGLYNVLNFWSRLWDRAKDIKTAVKNSMETWKWYHKMVRVPASIVTWAGSFLTWILRDVAATWRDLIWDLYQTCWNSYKNVWETINRLWKKDKIWDFKFAKIEQRDVTMPSILTKWFKPL